MKIQIKATELTLTPSLKTYIGEKLQPLARFVGRYDKEGAVEMRVEVARTTRHHKHGDVFQAEANLVLPGKMLRAVHADVDVRTAIDKMKIKLRQEIEKFKTKNAPTRARGKNPVRKAS